MAFRSRRSFAGQRSLRAPCRWWRTLLGSSRQLIIGTEGTVATLVAAALSRRRGQPARRLAAALALLVAGCFSSRASSGSLADYLSRPVPPATSTASRSCSSPASSKLGLSISASKPLGRIWEVAGTRRSEWCDGCGQRRFAVLSRCVSSSSVRARSLSSSADGASWARLPEPWIAVVGPIARGLPADVSTPPLADFLRLPRGCRHLPSPSPTRSSRRAFAGKHNQHVRVELPPGCGERCGGIHASVRSSERVADGGQRLDGRMDRRGLVAAGTIVAVPPS